MSALATALLHQDSCVFSACVGSFTAPTEQLAVGKTASIEFWQTDAEGQPQLAHRHSLSHPLQSVFTLPRREAERLDWLLVWTADDLCTLLEWSPASQNWATRSTKIDVVGDTVPHRIGQACRSSPVRRKEKDYEYWQWALAAFNGVIHVLRVTLKDGDVHSLSTKAFWTGISCCVNCVFVHCLGFRYWLRVIAQQCTTLPSIF